MKKILIGVFVLAVVGIIFIFTSFERNSSKKMIAAKNKLQLECNDLTKFDRDGRKYEFIVGRIGYMGRGEIKDQNASRATEVDGFSDVDDSSIQNYQIIFETDMGPIKVGREPVVDRHVDSVGRIYLKLIEETHRMSQDHIFGICAYKKEHDQYIGKMPTLSLLKMSLF